MLSQIKKSTHVCSSYNRHVLNLGPHNGLDSDGSNRRWRPTPHCIPQANLTGAFPQPLQESPDKGSLNRLLCRLVSGKLGLLRSDWASISGFLWGRLMKPKCPGPPRQAHREMCLNHSIIPLFWLPEHCRGCLSEHLRTADLADSSSAPFPTSPPCFGNIAQFFCREKPQQSGCWDTRLLISTQNTALKHLVFTGSGFTYGWWVPPQQPELEGRGSLEALLCAHLEQEQILAIWEKNDTKITGEQLPAGEQVWTQASPCRQTHLPKPHL